MGYSHGAIANKLLANKQQGRSIDTIQDFCAKISYRGNCPRPASDLISSLQSSLKISYITAVILANRGIKSVSDAEDFLYPTLRNSLPSPNSIKNIDSVVNLIIDSILQKLKITIYTDFDVDGLTSGAQLLLFLRSMGGKCEVYTPSRFSEGYGLNEEAIKKLHITGTNLLITVDCGVSSVKEIALAKRLGIRCIIIDHHIPSAEVPNADAMINPAQGGCGFQDYALCASGLVWMLIIAISSYVKSNHLNSNRSDSNCLDGLTSIKAPKDFLDLAALGTICDMVPLNKVNRLIALRGLEAIQKTSRPGMLALKETSGIRNHTAVSGTSIAFGIGPRINASGRLGATSEIFDLLITEDQDKAKRIAKKIESINTKRKAIEERMKDDCIKRILSEYGDNIPSAFAIYEENFHIGVIGIVAQRMVEMFNRPAAIMGISNEIDHVNFKKHTTNSAVIKGSVRGIRGFNVADVLHSLQDILISGGGHAAAGGFSLHLDKLCEFKARFIQAANDCLKSEDFLRSLSVDIELNLDEISFGLAKELELLAPHGIGNPSPLFLCKRVEIESVSPLGRNHVRVNILHSGNTINAVAWGFLGHPLMRKGAKIDIIFAIHINTYSGLSSLQLEIKDILDLPG